MRFLAFTLLAFCCTSCQHTREVQTSQLVQAAALRPGQTDIRPLFDSQFDATTYEFAISDPILYKASRWNVERDLLPLTPKKAESVAIEQAHKLVPYVDSWFVDDVVLRRVDDGCWYYEVLLLRADVAITGLPPDNYYLKIPVLMNGAAVHPLSRR